MNGDAQREPYSKQKWDEARNGYNVPRWGHRLAETLWGGPGVIGLLEIVRSNEKERRWIWRAILALLVLNNPIVGHFVLKVWFGQ